MTASKICSLISISVICLYAILSCKNQLGTYEAAPDGYQNDIPLQDTMQQAWQLLDAVTMNVGDELKDYAFTVLTESGLKTFLRMREYIRVHRNIDSKNPTEHAFASINACALNVDQVMWKSNLSELNYHNNIASIEQLESKIISEGGVVVALPSPHAAAQGIITDPTDPLLQFLNGEGSAAAASGLPEGFFDNGFPPGTLVLGYHRTKTGSSSGHSAIIGDVDADGTTMIYHNNWYRPQSSLYGRRYRFMTRISSVYQGQKRVRDWMATPWLWIKRDDQNQIIKVKNVTPAIDDMDPLNLQYQIKLAVPAAIIEDFAQDRFVTNHYTPTTQQAHGHQNIHSPPYHDPEGSLEICRVNLSLTDTSIRLKDFFMSFKHPDIPLPSRFEAHLNQMQPHEEERQMELYRHQSRTDPYQDQYELVTFYRSSIVPGEQVYFNIFLKKSAFTASHNEFNSVFCTTKNHMLQLNHAALTSS